MGEKAINTGISYILYYIISYIIFLYLILSYCIHQYQQQRTAKCTILPASKKSSTALFALKIGNKVTLEKLVWTGTCNSTRLLQ